MFLFPGINKLIRPSQPLRLLGLFSTETMKRNIRTVFLSNLPFQLNQEALQQAVAQRIGDTFTLRVPLSTASGATKGFGFVDLNDSAVVEDAIAKLQGLELDGREIPCKLSQPRKFQKDEDLPISSTNGLFIGNLPFDITTREVTNVITNAIGISSIKKITFPRGDSSRGFCHVYVADESLVEDTINKLDGLLVGNRPIHVDRSRYTTTEPYRKQTWTDPLASSTRNMNVEAFISNFDISVTKETVEKILDEVMGEGSYRKVRMMVDPNGMSKGFGFVEFYNETTAREAVTRLNRFDIMGRKLKVELARQKSSDNDSVRAQREIYLYHLPLEITESILRELLDDIVGPGQYVSIRFSTTLEGTSKGFAYVEFHNKEAAFSAINSLNGLEVMGKRIGATTNNVLKSASSGSVDPVEPIVQKQIFVFNIGFDCSHEAFEQFVREKLESPEVKVRLVLDRETRYPKGYGYVMVNTDEEMQAAIERLRGVMFMGRELKCDIALDTSNPRPRPRGFVRRSRDDRGDRSGAGEPEFASNPVT